MVIDLVSNLKHKTEAFEVEAHSILSKHENTLSRVITLDQTRKELTDLNLIQEEMLKQALTCVENGIYRAAHVMAWAAFIDYLQMKLSSDGLKKLKMIRPKWEGYTTIEDIRENIPDYQLIDASRELRLLSKGEMKSIQGLLAKRNECAHPSDYHPSLNESLGYINEIINRIKRLEKKNFSI